MCTEDVGVAQCRAFQDPACRHGYPPCLSSSVYRAHLHAELYIRGLRLAGILPCIPHCPTHPGSCSCLSPVDFADRLCLLRRVEDRQRGDRTSVYDHQHVVVDERVPSSVRPAVYAGVSPPSHRPLAIVRCHNSLFVYHDPSSLIVCHDTSSLIVICVAMSSQNGDSKLRLRNHAITER